MKKTVSGYRLEGCRFPFQPVTVLLVTLFVLLAACQPHQTVTLALLGDLNLGRGVTPTTDSFAFLTRDLSAVDLALANLESPFSPSTIEPSIFSSYNLCAPAERASFLADWGLDLLSIANNHANDCASGGVDATRSALAAAGLTGLTPEPVTLEINGLTLAFFAFDDVSAALDADAAAQAIHTAHENGALVVVSVHWGQEYQGVPSSRQEALAGQFVGAGAALVWGHHPHVLQPAEWIETAQEKTLVLYSLGNALFDQGGLDDTRQSALVLVTLDAYGVKAVEVIPFEIDAPHSRVAEPDAKTAEEILARLQIP